MKAIKLFSMAVAALMMAACSNEDNDVQQPAQTRSLHFVATIAAPNSGASTRTTYTEVTESTDPDFGKIKVAWEENDEIALLHNSKKEVVKVKTVNSDGSATIEGDITGASDGDDVRLVYPASGINADGSVPATAQAQQLLQNGTLAYIQNALDARMGTGKISVSGSNASLKENVTMASQMAIWKLTLQDNAATPNALSATRLKLTVGLIDVAAGTTSTARSEWYISYPVAAIAKGSITGDLTIRATVGTETYIYKKAGGVSLTAGKYYQSTVTMYPMAANATAADIGKLICTDGHIHAYNADAGCTADRVALITYVGSETGDATYNHGLAFALEDVSNNTLTWDNSGSNNGGKTAAVWCSAWNTSKPVANASWMLPSKDQWTNMVNACKNKLGTTGSSEDLRTGFGTRGGTDLRVARYWSSTEYDADATNAWNYDISGDTWAYFLKNDAWYVRSVLAF